MFKFYVEGFWSLAGRCAAWLLGIQGGLFYLRPDKLCLTHTLGLLEPIPPLHQLSHQVTVIAFAHVILPYNLILLHIHLSPYSVAQIKGEEQFSVPVYFLAQ
jgi:hypothetical protein